MEEENWSTTFVGVCAIASKYTFTLCYNGKAIYYINTSPFKRAINEFMGW